MNWTCCECENEYDNSTGDVDERMCDDCLEGESFAEWEKKMFDKLIKENIEMRRKILSILDRGSIYDLRDVFAALVEMGFKVAS